MKFIFHEKLYTDGMSARKIESIRNKIIKGSFKLGVFLITLPLSDDGILEIYRYPEFLQTVYKKSADNVVIVGLANSKEDAYSIVEHIVHDVGCDNAKNAIKEFFAIE